MSKMNMFTAEPGSSPAGSSSEAASSSAAGSSSHTVFAPSQLDEIPFAGLSWTCAACTYENAEVEGQYFGLRACSLCEQPRERHFPSAGPLPEFSSWACRACTFVNSGARDVCEVCSMPEAGPVLEAGPPASEWACNACTAVNDAQGPAAACGFCGVSRDAEKPKKRADAEPDQAVALTAAEERFFTMGVHSAKTKKLRDIHMK